MNRLTALDVVRAKWGPTGYAEYVWQGGGQAPLCRVSYGQDQALRFATAETFEEALAQLQVRQRA